MGDLGDYWRDHREYKEKLKRQRDSVIERDNRDLDNAMGLAKNNKCKVIKIDDNHYQLISKQHGWILNYYPSNGRIYGDPNHKTPFIELNIDDLFLFDLTKKFVKMVKRHNKSTKQEGN